MSEQMLLVISPVVIAGILASIAGIYFARREKKQADRERESQPPRP